MSKLSLDETKFKPPDCIISSFNTNKFIENREEEEYKPWENRHVSHPLGTTGALFHMIKGSLGTGILAMPVAFKNGGLWGSLLGAIFVGTVYTHCIHILVYSCQVLCMRLKQPRLGFSEIAEGAFRTGPIKWRRYTSFAKIFVDVSLFVSYYCCCIVYIVFTSSSLKQVLEYNVNIKMDVRMYILIMTILVIPLGLIRNLKYLVPFSIVAICALTFGCGFVLYDVFQNLPPLSSRPAFSPLNALPMFLSTMLFAVEGIGTVFPVENAMEKPQLFLGCPGVLNITMVWLIMLYAGMGFFGYLRYGEATKGSITLNISSSVLGQIVKVMVSFNVLCSYGLFFYVPSEILWLKLKPKLGETPYQTIYYYLLKLLLISGTGLLAAVVPDLEPFVGLVGAVCASTLVLLFPPVIELITFWEDSSHFGTGRWKLYKNSVIIFMWLVTFVLGVNSSVSRILDLYE